MITEVRYEPTCAYCREKECICDEIDEDMASLEEAQDEFWDPGGDWMDDAANDAGVPRWGEI